MKHITGAKLSENFLQHSWNKKMVLQSINKLKKMIKIAMSIVILYLEMIGAIKITLIIFF